jgi:hypothetical protein
MHTLQDYRMAAGAKLGGADLATNTTLSASANLITAPWPFKSLSNTGTRLEGYFVRRRATGETRTVLTPGGYTPASGTIEVDNAFQSALQPGEVFEFHPIFDPDVIDRLVNEVLGLIFLTDEVVVPGLDSVGRYSLTAAAPWLQNEESVRSASWLGPGETRDSYLDLYETRPLRGSVRKIGTTIWFSSTYQSQDVDLYFLCVRRHSTYCRQTALGVYGEVTGLVDDDDEATADPEWVATGVVMLAWQEFADVLEQSTASKTTGNATEAAAKFTSLSLDNFQMPTKTLRPLPRSWGPRNRYR